MIDDLAFKNPAQWRCYSRPFLLVLLIASIILSSCGGVEGSSSTVNLRIFAAASLTESFNELKAAYESEHEGITITYNFAGSQALAQQIIQGAQVDIFASANQTNMQKVVDANLIEQSQIFAKNELAVIVPASNPGQIETLKDLSKPGLKIDVAASEVPVGKYTQQVLDKLGADPEYGSGYVEQVKANIISYENNVKAVVQKVQLGEVDAGFIYRTDVTESVVDKIKMIEIPDNFNVIAEYPIAVIKDSAQIQEAQAFIDYLLSANGQAILEKYRFVPVA